MEARLWKFSARVIDLGAGENGVLTVYDEHTEKEESLDGYRQESLLYSSARQVIYSTHKFAVNMCVETVDLPAVDKWGNWKRGEEATLPKETELAFVDRGEFENLTPEEAEVANLNLTKKGFVRTEGNYRYSRPCAEEIPVVYKDGVFIAPCEKFEAHGAVESYVLEFDGRLWNGSPRYSFTPGANSFLAELIDSVKDELGESDLL